MKLANGFKKFQSIKFALTLTVVGLIIALIAGFMFVHSGDKTYEKVNATIVSITSEGVGEDETFSVIVSYEVDGKKYESFLGEYQSNWHEGDVIECEYDVDNPENISGGTGNIIILIVGGAGVLAFIYGLLSLIKSIKTPSSEFSQYDKVGENIDETAAQAIRENTELREEFIFHFTGKLNQSYIMEDKNGEGVYEAVCEKVTLVKDTAFDFRNLKSGKCETKMIGHTVTTSIGDGAFGSNIRSSFTIDGQNNWDYLAAMGYGFDFGLNGIKCHYEVRHHGVNIGSIEIAGMEAVNEKYKNNPLAKMPANGIFRISCQRSEIEGMFLIAFCLSKTEETLT